MFIAFLWMQDTIKFGGWELIGLRFSNLKVLRPGQKVKISRTEQEHDLLKSLHCMYRSTEQSYACAF